MQGSQQRLRLHVAINATSLAPGGGLTGLLGYLRAWRSIEAELQLTLLASRSAVVHSVQSLHPEVRVLPFAVDVPPAQRFAHQQLRLGRTLTDTGAHVVMTTNFLVPNCTVPQLVHHRNLNHFLHPSPVARLRRGNIGDFLRDTLAHQAVRGAAANVYVSQYLRARAEELVPESVSRNYVVPNGLDDEVIRTARSLTCSGREAGRVLSITSIGKHKDNPTLIRTLHALTQRAPTTPWQLVVAGGGPWDELVHLARALGVEQRVSFPGFLSPDALDAEYKRAFCALFASKVESFGNGPLEAMARRCAVVAARSTAMPEVIGDAGLLVEPGAHDAFADAILSLTEQNVRALAEKGLRQIERFNWNTSAARIYELLASVASGARRWTR